MLYNWGQTHISIIIRLEVLRSNHLHQEQQQCFTSSLYSSWFKDQMCNMLLLFAIVVLLNTVDDQRCWKRRKMWHNFNSFVGSSLLIWDNNTSKEMKNNSSRLNSWLTNWKFIGSCYELQLKKKRKQLFSCLTLKTDFLWCHKWLCHSVCHYADDRMSLCS